MSPVFFTDRDLGQLFPDMLTAAGILVERHSDHFEHDTPDEEWIAGVSGMGWSVLTHNKRIRYTPNEKAAVFDGGIGMFILIGAVPHRDLAQNFINTHRRVEAFLAQHVPPFIAKIYLPNSAETLRNPAAPGRVEPWL